MELKLYAQGRHMVGVLPPGLHDLHLSLLLKENGRSSSSKDPVDTSLLVLIS